MARRYGTLHCVEYKALEKSFSPITDSGFCLARGVQGIRFIGVFAASPLGKCYQSFISFVFHSLTDKIKSSQFNGAKFMAFLV